MQPLRFRLGLLHDESQLLHRGVCLVEELHDAVVIGTHELPNLPNRCDDICLKLGIILLENLPGAHARYGSWRAGLWCSRRDNQDLASWELTPIGPS